jgi:hypothetical protein
MPSGIAGGDGASAALARWGGAGAPAGTDDAASSSLAADKQAKLDQILSLLKSLSPEEKAYITSSEQGISLAPRVALVPVELSTESGEEADVEVATTLAAQHAGFDDDDDAVQPLPAPSASRAASRALADPPVKAPLRPKPRPPPGSPPAPAPPALAAAQKPPPGPPPARGPKGRPPPGSPRLPRPDASRVDTRGVLNLRQRVAAFYRANDASKNVDGLIREWAGRGDELILGIAAKYGQAALDASDRAALADPPPRTATAAKAKGAAQATAATAANLAALRTLEPLPVAYAVVAAKARAALKSTAEAPGAIALPGIEDGRDVVTETGGLMSGFWGALGYGDPSVIIHLGTSCVPPPAARYPGDVRSTLHARWMRRGEDLNDFTFRLAVKVNGLPLASPLATLFYLKEQVRGVIGLEGDTNMALCTDSAGRIPMTLADIDSADGSMPNELFYVRRLYHPTGAWESAERSNGFVLESAWRTAVTNVVTGAYPITASEAIKLATLQVRCSFLLFAVLFFCLLISCLFSS